MSIKWLNLSLRKYPGGIFTEEASVNLAINSGVIFVDSSSSSFYYSLERVNYLNFIFSTVFFLLLGIDSMDNMNIHEFYIRLCLYKNDL